MKLYDIPLIPAGYKTALAGWGTMLLGVGGFITAVAKLLMGDGDFEALVNSFLIMMGGLSVLGIGHKVERSTTK